MKTQKYLVTIEMPDDDLIGPDWLKNIIQGDCNIEEKVSVIKIKNTNSNLEDIATKDAYVSGEDEDEEDESNLDYYGEKIEIGSKVHWDDEAGHDEDGEDIEFTVVESKGDGYFNLSYGEEDKNPDRWAHRTELEVI